MSDLLDVLRSALNVIELSLEYVRKHADDTAFTLIQYTPVTLSSLRALSFKKTNTSFLPYMVVPALQELTGGSTLIDEFEFLERTGSSITHLSLHTKSSERKSCMDEDFMRALTCGPGDSHFTFDCWHSMQPWDFPIISFPASCLSSWETISHAREVCWWKC
ncbi:hypothetical protein DFH07DRAFT_819259 [Mycena maculata]|uniref:Uncharacterized protein n=1 Tax=Mycena maculata TaxID=230809 RepID=A0AAD7J606_9AGAR|nr:hypothetical protein DFH07DRAFT_819259 [Mycena maculata]